MAKPEFVRNFNLVCVFFGLLPDEVEAMRIMARGNMDAAESFYALLARRCEQDPRYGITERIKKDLTRDAIALQDSERRLKPAPPTLNLASQGINGESCDSESQSPQR